MIGIEQKVRLFDSIAVAIGSGRQRNRTRECDDDNKGDELRTL